MDEEIDQQNFYKDGKIFLEKILKEQIIMREIQLKILETKNKKMFQIFKKELEEKYKVKL